MLKRIILILFMSFFLSACAPFSFNVEKLMQPPKLSEEQNEVYSALISALGSREVQLKYPRSGKYISAFTFYDIDSDGIEEALVFYAYGDNEVCRVNILDKSSGEWKSVCGFSGSGSDIDTISFANLSSGEGTDIVIGWSNGSDTDKNLSIYKYEDGSPNIKKLFDGRYTQMSISDFNGDRRDEMILITRRDGTSVTRAQLVIPGINQLEVVSDIELSIPIINILQIKTGSISAYEKGIVIDGETSEGQTVSEVIAVRSGELVLPLEDQDLLTLSRRYERVLSGDINRDRIIDIPSQVLMPGYDKRRYGEPLYLTVYRSITDNGFSDIKQSFVNTSNTTGGYSIVFPEKWYGKVSAIRQVETGEVIFFKLNENVIDQSRELLRIRVQSIKDYRDKFESGYIKIGNKEMFSYYAYIAQIDDPLSIKKEELEEMFRLI